MAVLLHTVLTPKTLKGQLLQIEKEMGRIRDPNNKASPRTIDFDITLWGNHVFDYGSKPWHIPDSDLLTYAHTAIPITDVAPNMPHPETGQLISEIASNFSNADITPVDDIRFDE